MVKLRAGLFNKMAILLTLTFRFFQVLWTITTFIKLILAILTNPFKVFKKKTRNVPPACLIDLSLGTHEYITANGIKFHCVINGDPSKQVMLFLHGFPEFWFSWRYQLREFCKDYRVVAVDMRGYGETEKPAGVKNYTLDILKEDIVQLVKAISPDQKCILVGHDWGGIIGWRVVHNHPELFDKFIVMNCPYAKVYKQALAKGWAQLMKSWYIFMFQTPWLPECVLSLNDFGMFKAMYRGRRAGLRNRENFSDDILEAFKFTFSQQGAITPILNYYRNLLNETEHKGPRQPIDTPTLLIWGDDDSFTDVHFADNHDKVCTNITVKHIPNCSHWVQQDCPELTNQYMREFLEQ